MIEPTWVWGVVELVLLVTLCLVGVHIFAVLGALGSIFAILFYADTRAVLMAGGAAWSRVFDYTMSMIPLFILMGTFVEQAGLGRDAYDACMKWLSRVKGSLAHVAVYAQAIFGTVTGSSAASIATIGGISLPEMKRFGYSNALRTGAVASASTLSNLIPPSMVAIFYAVLTDESVGRLFIAGIIPGIILAVFYSVIVYVWVSLKPSSAPMLPSDVSFTLGEKIRSSAGIFPIVVIFLVLIGGIYLGWFGPTEAAGIGASTVLIVTLAYRRMNWRKFNTALDSAVRLSVMIMFLIMGAFVLTYTLSQTRLTNAIGDAVTGTGLTYIPLTYLIIGVFIIGGMFLGTFPLLVLFLPLFHPVLTTLTGAPPMAGIWFGTMVVVLAELGLLTPPIAGSIYITQMIDGCATEDVIKGVIPFYIGTVVLIVLLVQFPFLATWLPSKMIGG